MQFWVQGVLSGWVVVYWTWGMPQSAVLMRIYIHNGLCVLWNDSDQWGPAGGGCAPSCQTSSLIRMDPPCLTPFSFSMKLGTSKKKKKKTYPDPHAAALMKTTLWSIDPACGLIDAVFKNSLVWGMGELRGSRPSCRAHLSMFTQPQAFIWQHGERPAGATRHSKTHTVTAERPAAQTLRALLHPSVSCYCLFPLFIALTADSLCRN